MIRRPTNDGWLLISQVEHARLAAEIAAVWGNDDVPALPVAEPLVRAIRLHDDGWYDWETAPTVDPDTGRPRDFTEMPMAEAAAIWTRSIEIAGRRDGSRPMVVRRFHAAAAGEPPSPAQFAVLEAALEEPSRFSVERLAVASTEPRPVVEETLAILERANLVRRCPESRLAGDRVFEATVPFTPDPLGGTWVSRHFTHLAEEVAKHPDPADVEAAERFLAEQEERRSRWRPAIEAFAGDNTDRLVDGGYRLLRFFDWVSLWLCCEEREEATNMPLPGGPTIRFTPTTPGHFHLTPWPLATNRLEVTLPALQLPNHPYTTNAALHETLAESPTTELGWSFTPA